MRSTSLKRRPRASDRRISSGPLQGLGRLPTAPLKDTYVWADYVELRCAASADHEASLGELASWLRIDGHEAPDVDLDDRLLPDDLDVTQSEDEVPAEDGALDGEESSGRAASNSDNRRRLAEDVFRLLRYRVSLHGSFYPFELSGDGKRLSLRAHLNPGHWLYLFLLMCASGRYVVQHGKLTKDFERLCVPIFRAIVPTADVFIFGTADAGDGLPGRFNDKLRVLANKLSESPQEAAEDIDDDEAGDRGLDAVAVVGMGDSLGGKIAIFAQAACTDQWVQKQDSPSPDAWDPIIQLTAPALVACCIPFCYRRVTGRWHDRTKIHRRLVLDRRRILHWLGPGAEMHMMQYLRCQGLVGALVGARFVG